MKKSRSFFALLIFCLSFVLIPATAKAAMWEVPVAPGETFRWVFVTSDVTNALSSEISYYNDFVNGAADDAATPITGVLGKSTIADIEWRAIALTADQTGFGFDHEEDAKIFTPDSSLVSDSMYNLFVYGPENAMNVSEDGSPVDTMVWTGFLAFSWLGTPVSVTGDNTLLHMGWLYWITDSTLEEHHIYGISEELTVVPVPSALILGATGLLSSTLGLIRLRRKDQEPSQI